MKKLYATCLLCILLSAIYAQQPVLIKVRDTASRPVAGANITLFYLNKELLLKGIADSNGSFSFTRPQKAFYLSVSHVGYTAFKTTEVGTDSLLIILKNTVTQFKEINIVGNRPFIEQQPDKMVVNVDGNPKAGINAIEILKKIPGVVLNRDEFSLEGKSVTIMIDDKPTRLIGSSLISFLDGTPATSIGQMEIIYNPSAKYDAAGAGGIINIKTFKRLKPGYDANFGIGGGYGWKYPNTNTSAGLNYKTGNNNFYASYSYSLGKQYQEIQSSIIQKDLNQSLADSAVYNTKYRSGSIRAGFDHSMNKTDNLGILITGYYNSRNPEFTSRTYAYSLGKNQLQSFTRSRTPSNNISKGLNLNLNYKHVIDAKKEISIDADAGAFDYQNDSENTIRSETFNPISSSNRSYLQDGFTRSKIYSLKSDYTQKLSKGTLETGIKLSNVHIDNTFLSQFTADLKNSEDYGSNQFLYRETILAGYGNSKFNFGKFTLQLGLRAEQTFTNGFSVTLNKDVKRSYLNLFPNTSIGLKLKQSALSLSYGRRIGRPAYSELNPFVMVNSAYNSRTGNPYLNPSYTQNLRLAFTLRSKLSLSTSYSYTHDVITDLQTRDAQSEITKSLKANLSNYRNLGFNASYSSSIFKFWQLNYGLGISNSNYGFLYNTDLQKIKQTTGYLMMGNNFQLSKSTWVEIYFYGQSRVTYGSYINLPFSTTSISSGRKILKDRGNLSLSVNDIFFSGITKSLRNYGNIEYSLNSKYDSRNIRFNFSYRFGNTKIETRKRSPGSEDEQRRTQ